jgi:hypothetical protein
MSGPMIFPTGMMKPARAERWQSIDHVLASFEELAGDGLEGEELESMVFGMFA